jgi:CO/xanthine dehydrogenase FAD-binding subunit
LKGAILMSTPDQILRPKTPDEAAAMLEKLGDDAGLLWLGPRVEPPDTWTRPSMIDLSDIGLDYVKADADGLVIGAATPLQILVEDDTLHSAYGGLIHTAVRRLAHYGLRNLATVGGALMMGQGPPEFALALLALGCQAVLIGDEEQAVPVEALWASQTDGERSLLKEIRLPPAPSEGGGWGLEWVARSPMDQALAAASAAVELKDGDVAAARIATAGVGWTPARVPDAEAALEGQSSREWEPEKIRKAVEASVEPVAEFRASARYQKDMLALLAVRAASNAIKKAGSR